MVKWSKPVSQDPTVSTKVKDRNGESQGAIGLVTKSSAVATELLPGKKAVSEISAGRILAEKKVHNQQVNRELPLDGKSGLISNSPVSKATSSSEGSAVRTSPSTDQPRSTSTKAGNSETSTKNTQNSLRGKESKTMPRTRRHATPDKKTLNEREIFPNKEKAEPKQTPSKKISSRLSRSTSDKSEAASETTAGRRSREADRRKPERGRRRIGDVEASGRAGTRSRRKPAAD
jgi:hypothetical protein